MELEIGRPSRYLHPAGRNHLCVLTSFERFDGLECKKPVASKGIDADTYKSHCRSLQSIFGAPGQDVLMQRGLLSLVEDDSETRIRDC